MANTILLTQKKKKKKKKEQNSKTRQYPVEIDSTSNDNCCLNDD